MNQHLTDVVAMTIILLRGSSLTSPRCPPEDCLEFQWDLYGGSPRCCCCKCSWVDTLQAEGRMSSAPSALDLQKAAAYVWLSLGFFQHFRWRFIDKYKGGREEKPKWERQVCCGHAGVRVVCNGGCKQKKARLKAYGESRAWQSITIESWIRRL